MRRTILRSLAWGLALVNLCIVAGVLAGCARRDALKLHYLSGFVPGAHAIFAPASIAVTPISGDLASEIHEVGGIYDPAGHIAKVLYVADAGAAVHYALMTGLADAGLKPIALDSNIDPKDLSSGIDVMLACELQEIAARKNFATEQTIHGQYFTMTSRVQLRCKVQRRDGSVAYENEVIGIEDEPPKPVGGEVFFPLETEPAESLSVALSRAIGGLLIDPKFRAAFPQRMQ